MNQKTDAIESELQREREHLRRTVDEIEERLSPGRLMDEAFRLIDAGPGEFAGKLGVQLRDKPLPALLTGVGVAWMMMSRRQEDVARRRDGGDGSAVRWPTAEELEADDRWRRYQEALWATQREPDEAEDLYERRVYGARAGALGVTRRHDEDDRSFHGRVDQAAENVKRLAETSRSKLSEAARRTRHAASGAAHAVGAGAEAAGSGAKAAGRAVGAGMAGAANATRSAAAQSRAFHDDYPLASGAVGLAIGALIGSILPLSRQEFDRLKDIADEGLKEGAEAASAAARNVEETAREAEEGAREMRGA